MFSPDNVSEFDGKRMSLVLRRLENNRSTGNFQKSAATSEKMIMNHCERVIG